MKTPPTFAFRSNLTFHWSRGSERATYADVKATSTKTNKKTLKNCFLTFFSVWSRILTQCTMLDSSSSEDTGGESDLEPQRKPDASSSAEKRETGPPGSQQLRSATPGSLAGKSTKVNSATDEEQEKRKRESIQKEEEERKIKLQIYVFVLRCIAYPFNAKQPTDMSRRQQKVSYCCTPVECLLCKNHCLPLEMC